MTRETGLIRLAQAERLLAEGRNNIAKQESLIIQLERRGQDTAEAVNLLASLNKSQLARERERDNIQREYSANFPARTQRSVPAGQH